MTPAFAPLEPAPAPSSPPPSSPRSGRVLSLWAPEDPAFWQARGKAIARRNLWISIPALFLSFSVWMVWSVVVVRLPEIGFRFSTDQLFWLAALPGLSGATLRIFYSFMVPIFGGRLWTVLSTASLLIPAIGMGYAAQDPTTSYGTMLVLALLSGLGGGNFASSMANISFFFPKEQKGTALGLNAGLGNLGVSGMQFVVPLVITAGVFGALGGAPQAVLRPGGGHLWLQNAGFIWVPFIVICTVAAWFGMNDIASAKASFRDQSVIFRRKHNWLMCWLYVGTFGSFIGYSAGLPLLIRSQFPGVDPVRYAFLGPLVGAMARPVGGWLSDKVGGARVTLWNFVVMALAAAGVIVFLPSGGAGGSFAGFLAAFLVLFTTSGIGNGSTFRMIPVIFGTFHERRTAGRGTAQREQAGKDGAKESAAVIGFSSAVAAYGAFFIPRAFGFSMSSTGSPAAALVGFIALYVSCLVTTWWYYARRNAEMPS
jgi:NNP family nitrate/nitrite transporter-like MFS transporter